MKLFVEYSMEASLHIEPFQLKATQQMCDGINSYNLVEIGRSFTINHQLLSSAEMS